MQYLAHLVRYLLLTDSGTQLVRKNKGNTYICLWLPSINFHGFITCHSNSTLVPNLIIYDSMIWWLLLFLHTWEHRYTKYFQHPFLSNFCGPEESDFFLFVSFFFEWAVFLVGGSLWSKQRSVEPIQGRVRQEQTPPRDCWYILVNNKTRTKL